MASRDWTRIWHNAHVDVRLLQAHFVDHAFPRHSHEYYVVCLITQGLQSFSHAGTKYFTPPGRVILINPEVVHTGEAADSGGFEMVCFYPTVEHMEAAVFELTGRRQALPFFREPQVDDPWLVQQVLALHNSLTEAATPLEYEARFTWTLVQMVRRYADIRFPEQQLGRERKAIQQARRYIDEFFAEGINLTQLAEHVSLSPYYLLRAFRAEVGMPPYSYLESVRVRQAQRLIEAGKPMAEVAVETGFSSQSHLINRFKQIIGVTPGQYAQ